MSEISKRVQLYKACKAGDVDTVRKCISSGVDVNEGIEWWEWEMEMRIKQFAKTEYQFERGTPLYAAARNGHAAVVDILLEAGADVNKGESPLFAAALLGHAAIVKMLLKAGADVNKETPLYAAAVKGNIAIVEILLKAGADVNMIKYQETPLYAAAGDGHAAVVDILLEAGADVNEGEETPLYAAAEKGHAAIVEILLKAGADVNKGEVNIIYQKTPLYAAAEKGHAAIVEILLKAGADVNKGFTEDQKGNSTPLHIAAEKGYHDVIAILLSYNADSNIKNKNQKIAMEIMSEIYQQHINEVFTKKATRSVTEVNTELQKTLPVAELKLLVAEKRASIAEERAAAAEQQATELTTRCRLLQDELNKAKVPTWVVKKEDIVFTDKEIGRGAYGIVKAAGFCGLNVVAKFLHTDIISPYYQQQFKREMDISAQIRHPNIVLFIGATVGQECIILIERMQTSLRAVLEDKQSKGLTMTRQQVSSIATDVGVALNYLHLWKPDAIIHRDISSSNVLLESLGADKWKAKVSDFGSSNFARQVKTAAPGCYTYAAPESLDPDKQSPKMDIYSYGILLLEVSCTKFPDLQNRQVLIRELSWSALKTLIESCITKEPGLRPNMADVLKRLPSI